MNISPILNALPIQAPSSKLIPTWPFRSAVPKVIMRPASVTIPAPMITPRMPSSGLFERSAGPAATKACAICAEVGCGTTVVEAAIQYAPLVRGAHRGNNGEPGTQRGREVGIIEGDLHRDSLHHLRVIPGGVVRRQQRKLRTAGWSNFEYLPLENFSRIFIDAQVCRIADFHIGQLRLAIIGLYPFNVADERDRLGPGRDQLPGANLPFTHGSIAGRFDFGVAQIHLRGAER